MVCPVCGSKEIDAGRPDINGTDCWVTVFCQDCKHDWVELYTLSGYGDMNDPEGNRIDYPDE